MGEQMKLSKKEEQDIKNLEFFIRTNVFYAIEHGMTNGTYDTLNFEIKCKAKKSTLVVSVTNAGDDEAFFTEELSYKYEDAKDWLRAASNVTMDVLAAVALKFKKPIIQVVNNDR